MRIVFDSFERFRQMKNLYIDCFDEIKDKQMMDRLYELTKDYESLEWGILLPLFTSIFGANNVSKYIFDIKKTIALPNILKLLVSTIVSLEKL